MVWKPWIVALTSIRSVVGIAFLLERPRAGSAGWRSFLHGRRSASRNHTRKAQIISRSPEGGRALRAAESAVARLRISRREIEDSVRVQSGGQPIGIADAEALAPVHPRDGRLSRGPGGGGVSHGGRLGR